MEESHRDITIVQYSKLLSAGRIKLCILKLGFQRINGVLIFTFLALVEAADDNFLLRLKLTRFLHISHFSL